MGSYEMHISLGSIIKEMYNFSDKFLLGSALPDLLKRIHNDRRGTHYIKDIILPNNSIKRLPDLEKFEMEYKTEMMKGNEEILGYYAHLIEDYIWFDKYVSKYVEFKIGESKRVFMHCINNFCDNDLWVKAIYNDYSKNAKYIYEKSGLEREDIKRRLINVVTDNNIKEKINEEIIEHPIYSDTMEFLTKSQIDEYFEDCINKITKEFDKYKKKE